MKRRYMSLMELMCILAVTAVTGSLATKLFFSFVKQSKSLEMHQDSQRDFRSIVRSCRTWAAENGPELDQMDGKLYSGESDVFVLENKIYFRQSNKKMVHPIPKNSSLSLSVENDYSGKALIVLQSEKNGIKHSIKIPMGEGFL